MGEHAFTHCNSNINKLAKGQTIRLVFFVRKRKKLLKTDMQMVNKINIGLLYANHIRSVRLLLRQLTMLTKN